MLKERIEKLEHQTHAENAARQARLMYHPIGPDGNRIGAGDEEDEPSSSSDDDSD